MTAWGRLLTLDSFDADLMQQFSDAYRGNVGPEAGVCFQESTGGGVMNP